VVCDQRRRAISLGSPSRIKFDPLDRRSLDMKPRLLACLVPALLAIGASAVVPTKALAQGEQPSPGQSQGKQSADDRARQGGQLSEDVNSALQAYEERMGRNLEQCRKELDQMKKELHDLIDLRIKVAMSLAELRVKKQPQGGIAYPGAGAQYATSRGYAGFSGGGGQAPQGGEDKHRRAAALANELQQLHNQLRAEVDQQRNQIAQLVDQVRALQHQDRGQGSQSQGPAQGTQSGQGQGQPAHSQGQSGQPQQGGNQGGAQGQHRQ
jgi:hypothetical protein